MITDRFFDHARQTGESVNEKLHELSQLKHSEQSLRNSEERYRTILANIQEGYFECDLAGKIVFCNSAFCLIHGLGKEEILNANFRDYVTPETARRIYDAFHQVYLSGEPLSAFEIEIGKPDGTFHYVEESVSLFYDEHGNAAGFRGIVRDTTERRKTEEQISRLEEQFRNIANNAPVMIWMSEPDKACSFFNQNWLNFTGRTLEQERGNGWTENIYPDDLRKVLDICTSSFNARIPFKMEFRMRRHDGVYRWVLDEGVPRYLSNGEFVGFIGGSIDITERKETEEALRQSEERYRTILETINDGYFETNLAGQLTFVNDGLVKMFGHKSKDELVGLKLNKFTEEPHITRLRKLANKIYHTGKQAPSFVYELNRLDGLKCDVDMSLSLIEDNTGQPKGFRGIIRDVTKRRRDEKLIACQIKVLERIATGAPLKGTLEVIVQLIEELFDNEVGAILLLDEEREHLQHNTVVGLPTAYVRAIGGIRVGPCSGSCGTAVYTRQTVIVSDIAKDPLWTTHRDLALSHGLRACWSVPVFSITHQVLGTIAVYSRVVGAPEPEELELIEVLANLASVAIEQSSAEAKLQASEARFRALTEKSSEGISLLLLDSTLIYTSPAIKQIMGYDPRDVIGTKVETRIYPEDLPRFKELIASLSRTPGRSAELSYRSQHKDGSWRWMEATFTNLLEEQSVQAITLNYRDISKRKQAEDALRASEERFAKAFNASPQPMAILELPSRKYINVNEALVENSGWTMEEMIGRTPGELNVWANPEDPHRITKLFADQGTIRNLETKFRTKDGKIRDFLYSAEEIVFDSKPHILIVANDITERNRAEEALRQNEALLRSIIESNPDWIFVKDLDHRYRLVNQSYADALHLRAEDFIGKNDLEVGFPEEQVKGNLQKGIAGFWAGDRDVFMTGQMTAIKEEPVEVDGQTRVFSTFKVPLFDGEGKVWGVLGVGRDITELKQAEAALRDSEERFAKAFNASPQPMVIFEAAGRRIISVNNAMVWKFGWQAEEMLGKTPDDLNFWVDMEQLKYVRALLAEQGVVQDMEIRFRTKSGEIREFLYSAETVSLKNSLHVLVVVSDITERLRTERALQESEERYRLLFEHGFAGIFRSTVDGRILDCNDEAAKVFGYESGGDLLHVKPEELYFDDKQRKGLIDELQKNGSLRNYELLMKRKDGSPVWVLTNITLLGSEEGGEQIVEGVLLDITERKLIEQELAQSYRQLQSLSARVENVREEERTRIAREIHDNLGQALTGLKMDFSWLEKTLSRTTDETVQGKATPKLKEIAQLLEETIQTVRDIATELRPGLLDTLGLCAAIDWQAQAFGQRSGIKCKTTLCEEPQNLPMDRSTALYRIFQEILTNIARHSKAQQFSVTVAEIAHNVILTVHDDGIGITEEQLRHPKSLGLIGMRERALAFGGSMQISGSPEKGTTVRVILPTCA